LALNAKSDVKVLEYATKNSLVVLTCDSDFGRIAQSLTNFHGIVYLRPNHIRAEHHLETLKHIINQNLQFQPPFILVAEHYDDVIRIRLRNKLH
jgi:predicted nuclease of predicted toxin-antitoxin system